MSGHWHSRTLVGGLLAFLLGGVQSCATAAPPPAADVEPGGEVLSREAILKTGARDALEAIEKLPTHLLIQHTRDGTPVRILYRGIGSFVLSPEVLVVIDGTPVTGVAERLQGIPTESIAYIQILSGREAAVKWGSNAGSGVILVRTTARSGGGAARRPENAAAPGRR